MKFKKGEIKNELLGLLTKHIYRLHVRTYKVKLLDKNFTHCNKTWEIRCLNFVPEDCSRLQESGQMDLFALFLELL